MQQLRFPYVKTVFLWSPSSVFIQESYFLFYRQGAPESNVVNLPTFASKLVQVIDPVHPSVPLELSSSIVADFVTKT